MNELTNLHMWLDLLTVAFMIFGVFFMTLAPLGLLRLPDLYHRMHAATKAVTLGIVGLMIAAIFALSLSPDVTVTNLIARAVLIIVFQFVANPVGAHLLSKAAHLDNCPKWENTISDELQQDREAA